jgi:hypothetical protein
MPYDPGLAGKSVVCSYCKRPVLVPQLQALPPEIQDEYRREVEMARGKQELERRRQEEAERRWQQAAEDTRKEARKREEEETDKAFRDQQQAEEARRRREQEAEEARRLEIAVQESGAAKRERDTRVREATIVAPEEEALTNRYPALQTIATIIKVITVAIIVLNSIGWLVETGLVIASSHEPTTIGTLTILGSLIAVAVINVLVWAFGFAYAELILLAIDVSNDMRINRFSQEA